jgi:hypothetical protein
MPEQADFGLQVYRLRGRYDCPDGDGTVCTCCDKGFGVGKESRGELSLMHVLEQSDKLCPVSAELLSCACGDLPFLIRRSRT